MQESSLSRVLFYWVRTTLHQEVDMNFRNPFSKKVKESNGDVRAQSRAPSLALSVDALDACVGGRASTEGVDCYMQSEQSRSH